MIPHRTPFFLPLLYPSLLWRCDPTKKELYLTFDDGPVVGPTEFVLDTLAHYAISATFFCIGDNVKKHPALMSRIVQDGHQIGNHTYNHLNGWRADTEDYVANVTACDFVLKEYLPNVRQKLFRPPYGRITKKQIGVLADYEIVMWDVLTLDYDRHVSEASCLHKSVEVTRPGSIIVFHDSVKAERNLRYTLPRYIERCMNDGYNFKSLIL